MKKPITLSFLTCALLLAGCSNDAVVREEIPTETPKTIENVKMPSPNETASPVLNKDQTEAMANSKQDQAPVTQESTPPSKEEPSSLSEDNPNVLPEVKKTIIDGYTDISFYPELTTNDRLKDITAKELLSAIGNPDKTMVVFLANFDDGHCQNAIVKVQEAAIANGIDVHFLTTSKTTYEERDELTEKLDPILLKDADGVGEIFIPHVFAIVNGELSKDYSKLGFAPDVTDYDYIFKAVK